MLQIHHSDAYTFLFHVPIIFSSLLFCAAKSVWVESYISSGFLSVPTLPITINQMNEIQTQSEWGSWSAGRMVVRISKASRCYYWENLSALQARIGSMTLKPKGDDPQAALKTYSLSVFKTVSYFHVLLKAGQILLHSFFKNTSPFAYNHTQFYFILNLLISHQRHEEISLHIYLLLEPTMTMFHYMNIVMHQLPVAFLPL